MDDARWSDIIDDATALVSSSVAVESVSQFETVGLDPRELVGID